MLPVLHLNGYKIANPTVLARIPEAELLELMRGYGYEPHVVAGDDPAHVHQAMAAALDRSLDAIADIQTGLARGRRPAGAARWPMIVLRTPKGWTGPPVVDGQPVEGTFRVAPGAAARRARGRRPPSRARGSGCARTGPRSCSTTTAVRSPELLDLVPDGERRMSANPVANGGAPLASTSGCRTGASTGSRSRRTGRPSTRRPGCSAAWLREVTRRNPDNFRVFAPDELASNRLQDVLEVTGRDWQLEIEPNDVGLDRVGPGDRGAVASTSARACSRATSSPAGTACSPATRRSSTSSTRCSTSTPSGSRRARGCRGGGRSPSLNYLLSSHVWRQDHNGSTHQDPGFLDVVMNKKPGVVRVYLPPDANTLALAPTTTASDRATT